MSGTMRLDDLTSPTYGKLVEAGAAPLVVLLPVGSVEPHGPHLPLSTDTILSVRASEHAVAPLLALGVSPWIAPPVPYGVTECAAGFPGAVSIAPAALVVYVDAVVRGFLAAGATHVCIVNNHLEPAHDAALRQVSAGVGPQVSVACPLTRRWARTLSDEFKSGQCHAGRYETALVLAHDGHLVDESERRGLSEVPVSLSDGLSQGKSTFLEMGMADAYAGAPAQASAAEGEALYEKLSAMIVGEVAVALGLANP